jgi:hypothetical protein
MFSLLATICFGLLISILDPDTYTPLSDTDTSECTIPQVAYAELAGSGAEDRRQNAYVRGLGLSLLDWMHTNFRFKTHQGGYHDPQRFTNRFMAIYFSSLDLYIRQWE